MPIQVTCQSCRGTFNAPDTAGGKRAKCPTCGGVIQIPTQPGEEVLDAEAVPAGAYDNDFSVDAPADGEERKQCPMCGELIAVKAIKCRFCGEVLDASMRGMILSAGDASDPGWRRVRSGLSTIYYSIITIIGAVVMMALVAIIVGAANAGQQNADPPVGLIIAIIVCGLVMLGAGIGALVGQILCTNVPERSGARGLAIGAAVCMVVNILFSMVGGAAQAPAINSLGSLISLVGSILSILFIRRAATYLNDHQLASSAGRFLIFSIAVFVGMVFLVMVAVALGAEAVFIVMGLGFLVAALVSVVWYLRLIKSLIRTIDSGTAAR